MHPHGGYCCHVGGPAVIVAGSGGRCTVVVVANTWLQCWSTCCGGCRIGGLCVVAYTWWPLTHWWWSTHGGGHCRCIGGGRHVVVVVVVVVAIIALVMVVVSVIVGALAVDGQC